MLKLYSVRDAQLGFGGVFTAANDAVAIRTFASAVNSEGSILHDAPEDFSLCRLGEFNEVDGVIVADLPTVVTSAISVRKEVD